MNEPAFVENGICPHCGASPTARRNDQLQPLCMACMLGRCEVVNAGLATSRLAEVFRQAVPMEIFRLQELSEEQFRAARQQTVEQVQVQPLTETILVGRGDPVRAALELSLLVRGVAMLAFLPDGVPLFGMRWTAHRPPATAPVAKVARGRKRA